MMKFSVQCVRGKGARLGQLTEVGCHGNKTFKTPMCLLYTRGGSAPHLTIDMLKKIEDLPLMAHMPITILADHQETLEAYKSGMAKFAAMQDFLVFTSNQDPGVEVPSGFNDVRGVAVWGKGGKMKMDVDQFMKLQEAILPDWYQALSDGDTQKDSGKKRIGKSVSRTLDFLDKILDIHSKSERLKNSEVFGVIEGGYSDRERIRSAKETSSRSVSGFVIEGFHSLGPKSETFKFDEICELLRITLDCLPEDKPRMMAAVWRPDNLLEAIKLGIDIFDSSYPHIVTERGGALIFTHSVSQTPEDKNGLQNRNKGFEINLKDKHYFEDFSPILGNCKCYTCQNFTKSYISHLLNTSELLASVLLIIHNFHHYFQYFNSIRAALAADRFDALSALIQQQCPEQTGT